MTFPRIAVVVRSLGRIPALVELLEALLRQDHDAFEIVVIEQTPSLGAADAAALTALAADPGLRIVYCPPMGGPAARNLGVRTARAPLVAFIDDDDLPANAFWLREMEAHFADPAIAGVSCRQVRRLGETMPYVSRALARRKVLHYSLLKTPYTFARFDEDVTPVAWLHGTNSAVRRDVALAAGLWDEDIRTQDEHSFAFRFLDWAKSRNLHFAFRAGPVALRRMDLPGGMAKRKATLESTIANHARFQHLVIGRYHPRLYRRLRPVYRVQAFARVLNWVWDGARDASLAERARLTLRLLTGFWREDRQYRN